MLRRSRPPIRVAGVLLLALALTATGCAAGQQLSTEEAIERTEVATTKLYADDGTLFANLHGEINRDIVSLDDVPSHLQNAVIAIEDQRFWTHHGIDVRSITRAAISNMRDTTTLQGGSTISQQLVKNIYFPSPERTMARKVAEARYTIDFERRYSKQRILEMYLNTIYLGRGAYGFEAASKLYFGKNVGELTQGEAAFLAGLIHEPGLYEFVEASSSEDRDDSMQRALNRRNTVLGLMHSQGLVTAEQADAAREEPLEILPRKPNRWEHPYFVDYVLRTLGVLGARGDLDPRFDVLGTTVAERTRAVYQGGYRIHTTLDLPTQRAAEQAVSDVLPESADRLSAAAVTMDPRDGAVKALVGGRNYYPTGCDPDLPRSEQPRDCQLAKVNLALGRLGGGSGRQPGSSFKTVVLASALEHDFSLADRFNSSPFTTDLPVGEWTVRNYEGSGGGRMSVLDGTVSSVNAVYARLQTDGLGPGDPIAGSRKVADMARKLGIDFPTPEQLRERCGENFNQHGGCTPADVVPAIALGAKEVSPLEMARAYATLANEGIRVEPTPIRKITDRSGKVVWEAETRERRVISEDVARGVTYALRQAVERGTGTGARLRDRQVAGKTGTSQMWRDAWFNGYVPQLVTSVWVGNPIPRERAGGAAEVEPMTPANGYPRRVTGGSYPASIWQRLMVTALQDTEPARFAAPPSTMVRGGRDVAPDSKTTQSTTNDVQAEESELRQTDGTNGRPLPGRAGRAGSAGTGSVPGVVGMSLAAAQNAVARAGFRSAAVRGCPPGGGHGGLRVYNQSPGGGAAAPAGSTVTLWYANSTCR